MAGRTAPPLTLRGGDRPALQQLIKTSNIRAVAMRARIVLLAAEGLPNVEIAARVRVSRPTVNLWRRRYAIHGLDGLVTEGRRMEATIPPRSILLETLRPPPPEFKATHWSSRLLGRAVGVSHVTITRAWREFGIRPSGPSRFTFATEPSLDAAVTDLLGLYVTPVECAVMLRALPGDAGDVDPDAQPESTTDAAPAVHATELRAALRVAAERATPWHRPVPETQTVLNFLEVLHRNHPSPGSTLVLDNVATAQRGVLKKWLGEHPEVNVVTTRSSSDWLKLVDTWLTLVTIRSTADPGEVSDLMRHLRSLITRSTAHPFVWTKRPTRSQRHRQVQPPRLPDPVPQPRSAGLPGTRGFPFVAQAGHTQVAPDRIITYPRVQSRAVVGCHTGRGRVILNGQTHPLHPGLLYLLPWDHSIEYQPDPRDPFFVFGIHVIPWQSTEQPMRFSAPHDERDQYFGVDWRRSSAPGDTDDNREVVVTTEGERPGLAALTRYAVERFLRGLPSPMEARSLGVLAMSELNATSSLRPEENPSLPAGLRGLLVWIMRDLGRDLSLAEMAEILECSPSTVNRQFRRYLGCSPMTWVIDQRIERAQRMLASGNPTISAVARGCGYDDPEYFSRLFKARVGSTPRDWRRFRTI